MAEPIEILVDTEVQVPAEQAPKKVVDALRRQLRQHDLARLLKHDGSQRALLNLLQTHQGLHRLPQGLLNRVTQTLTRHGVPFAVVDRRAMVSCPAIRSAPLAEAQQMAARRLLAHDSGVLVAGEAEDRRAVALELIARRQQRTLVLVNPDRPLGVADVAESWLEAIDAGLSLTRAQLALIDDPRALSRRAEDLRVVVASCATAAAAGSLGQAYGMVIFDGLHAVDPVTLMRAVRATDARYLLGLSAEAMRGDSLGEPLFLALGGVVHQLPTTTPRSPRLSCRPRATRFTYPSYEGRSQYQALIASLAADTQRNEQIAADVAQEARAEQPCLVLSERRDQLDALFELLPDDLATERVSSAVRPSERKQIVARFERGETSVLLATSQVALELVRTPRVSRLFIAFPFSYARRLEKLVGLLRQPAPDKALVALYDYDDVEVTPLHRAFDKRARLLERLRRDAERDYLRWAQLDLLE